MAKRKSPPWVLALAVGAGTGLLTLLGLLAIAWFSPVLPAGPGTSRAAAVLQAGARSAASPSAAPSLDAGTSAGATDTPGPAPGWAQARCVRVVDGDTIDVEIAGHRYTVRYLGIDAPETVHPEKAVEWMGREATAANRALLEGRTLYLEKDVSDVDPYGRLLRYVYAVGLPGGFVFVNAELVRQGYARVATYPPDLRYQDLLLLAQRQAQEKGAGLWGPTPLPTSSAGPTPSATPQSTPMPTREPPEIAVEPSCSQFDAPGDDNTDKEEEWVCFQNLGSWPAFLTGWRLHDEHGWSYTFPPYILLAGAIVQVHTGCGTNTPGDLFWCNDGTAVWNNEGDTVFLFDAAGILVNQYSYR